MLFFEFLFILFFLLIFNSIFGAFVGGCFGLIAVFMVMGFLLVLLSINFIWIAGIVLVICASNLLIKYYRWYRLPDLNAYLAKYPQTKHGEGVSCCKCESLQTNHHGLYGQRSKFRFYVCSSCGTTLFRFKVL